MKRPITLAILFLIAFASMSYVPAARASDQIVTDAGDNGGADQLRAKIVAAQSSGGGTITFHIGPAIITLAGILPAITTNISIDGANLITLSGNNATPLFQVNS